MTIPISIRLAIRQWVARPLRPVLCSLAIGSAVALIVVVGVVMDSLRASVDKAIGQVLGVAEIHVRMAQRGTDARVPESMLAQLRARPDVELASGRLGDQAYLTTADDHRLFDVVGIEEPNDETLRPKIFESGHTLTGAPDEILIDTAIAKEMKLKVGDEVAYKLGDNAPRAVKIVGVVRRPDLGALTRELMFVPLEALWKDLKIPHEYSVIDLKLRHAMSVTGGAEEFDYDAYAKELGKELGPAYEVTPGTNSKAQMTQTTRTLRLLLALLSALAGVCASLIIGTTLSVGVQERVRQFGQWRCIGASRGQLASFLLGDALVMLVIGEVIGLALGLAAAWAVTLIFTNYFQAFVATPVSLLIACGCGAFATLLGALIPMWQVTQVPPMAAVTAVARRPRLSRVILAAGIGVLCLVAQQVLWYAPASRDVRVLGYIFVGVELIFVGWCLTAPGAVMLCERVGAQVLGRLFFVGPSLLRSAWSRTPWRSGAIVAALMIGVTIFIAVRARGESVLESFPVPQVPDLVVLAPWGGINEQRLALLKKNHPELRDFVLFDTVSAKMEADTGVVGKLAGDGTTTFIATDVRKFAAQIPMTFVQGDRETALAKMNDAPVWGAFHPRRQRYVFVTTEFAALRKKGVGDKLTFKTAAGQNVVFEIAAVVASTNLEMVKNYFDLRQGFGDKTVSSVLGTIYDARKEFKMGDPKLMLVNVDPAQMGHLPELKTELEGEGYQMLSTVEMKNLLRGIVERLINGLSVVGLGALCLASFGVANMVIASIHARRYEFGVLRAIGAGRWQLVRLVLAEVTLMGLVAGVLGASAGLWYAYMISRVDRVSIGLETSFINPDPWLAARYCGMLVLMAVGITTLLGWVAAVVPAVRGARGAQRVLLAGGRG